MFKRPSEIAAFYLKRAKHLPFSSGDLNSEAVNEPNALPQAGPVLKKRRWQRWCLGGVVTLLFVLGVGGYFFGYDLLKAWVESASGQRVASDGLGRAIKVDGTFAPLRLNGWTITTDSFTSEGWPGEAIGVLNTYGITAEFDPSAIRDRAWRIKGIAIDHAMFSLLKPNDALKRKMPPKKPKPWYALFLPDRFECGPIICPHTILEFPFQGEVSRLSDAHVQADLIGRDLRYTATSGTLAFPYFPPMTVQRLVVMVTRPLITVSEAKLAASDPADPARLALTCEMGMRENKTIDAVVDLVEMPIEQILPENLRGMIEGRVTGHLVWKRNATGDTLFSEGDLQLTGAKINNLSVFRELTELHSNPDLQSFAFDTITCHFKLENGCAALHLQARVANKFTLRGDAGYDLKTKNTDLDLAFTDLPLKTWMPTEFKPRYNGMASAKINWHGQLNTMKDSSGTVDINLDGTHISNPMILRKLLAPKKLRTPNEIDLQTMQMTFAYHDDTFYLTRGVIVSPGLLSATLTGNLTPDHVLNATLAWQGLQIADWLPPELAEQFSGDINGDAQVQVSRWKLENGAYAGRIKLLRGVLYYTEFQSLLARFVNDKGLLKLPLTRAEFSWRWDKGQLDLNDLNLLVADKLGLKGSLTVSAEKNLSGVLWVGTKPKYLAELGPAADPVFSPGNDGLVWAKVTLSGTLKKPKEDLAPQLIAQIQSHPLVLVSLAVKLASWYLGNLFGAADEWKRPAPAEAAVAQAAK